MRREGTEQPANSPENHTQEGRAQQKRNTHAADSFVGNLAKALIDDLSDEDRAKLAALLARAGGKGAT